MATEQTVEETALDVIPAREPEGSASIIKAADDNWLANVTKAAENAPALEKAMNKILLASTRAEDWTIQGDMACLGSAGAERLLKHFPITFRDWKRQKEEWADTNGKAYRWRYTATASLWGREVLAEGVYSSRDKFLGFVNGEWRPIEDINENNIMAAARHICIGAGIKSLLGLRRVPKPYYEEIMRAIGQSPQASGTVQRGNGSQGGISDDDRKHQDELWKMLIEMCGQDVNEATMALKKYTEFQGKDGPVSCENIRRLRGKWLGSTLGKVRTDYAKWQQSQDDNGPGSEG